MRVHLPAKPIALGVDRDDDALITDDAGRIAHQVGRVHCRGVDRYLVGARIQEPAHVFDLAHAAADGERDEDARSHRFDHMQQDVALVGARGNVEEAQLVRTLAVVARRDLHRITGVAQADEIHALHHPAGGDVQAGDHPLR